MPLVAPTSITALPSAPDPNNRATFNILAYPWSVALNPFGTQLTALGSNVYDNAVYAVDTTGAYLTSALTAKDLAESAAAVSAASANFKGLWSTLTGALNKPASVKHNDRFWLLLNNLANVATSQPGVSADWTSTTAGTEITQVITTTTAAVAGVTYLINATGIELDIPTTGLLKGDTFGVCLLATSGTQTIDIGSLKVNKQTLSDGKILLNVPSASFKLVYEDATIGLWIK